MNYQTQDFINLALCGLTMIGIVFFSRTIFRNLKLSQYIPLPNRVSTIDGLRGYLALLVLFHHFSLTYYWLKLGVWQAPTEIYFQNFGKVGVSIFFMITGYLFIGKIIRDKFKLNLKHLILSRIFRIMPLYFFVFFCILVIVAYLTNFKFVVDGHELVVSLFRWLLFQGSTINGFDDARRIIAGVDWTLKYEWFFYICLPFLAVFFRLNSFLSTFIISILVLYLFFFPIKFIAFNTIYLILFLIGGWISYLVNGYKNKVVDNYCSSFFALLLLGLSIFIFEPFSFPQVLAMSLFFTLIVFGTSLLGLLKTDFSIFLGEISYSIYLLHGLVLYITYSLFPIYTMGDKSLSYHLSFLPLISFTVILVSSLTYIYIEKPSMIYGKVLQKK